MLQKSVTRINRPLYAPFSHSLYFWLIKIVFESINVCVHAPKRVQKSVIYLYEKRLVTMAIFTLYLLLLLLFRLLLLFFILFRIAHSFIDWRVIHDLIFFNGPIYVLWMHPVLTIFMCLCVLNSTFFLLSVRLDTCHLNTFRYYVYTHSVHSIGFWLKLFRLFNNFET